MAAPTGEEAGRMKTTWAEAVDRVKRQVTSTMFYRALERTVPIAWETNAFVVGFEANDGQMAGQINTGENQAIIERVLQDLTGDRSLRLRVIEGASYEDWASTKERDAVALAARQQTHQKRTLETATFGSWDEIYERVSRMWASAEYRNIATGRGRFLDVALQLVSDAMDAMYPTDGKTDDLAERGLSRVVERVASMTSSDPAVLAYLLFERRKK